MLNRETISSTEEKRIALGMIVSTEFLEQIQHIFKIEYFTNSYLNTIALWCTSFFDEYKKAPYIHIRDIYNAESHHLPETDSELIATLLQDLESQYSEGEINLKYWVEMAGDYFRSRELEITVNNISVLKEKGDLASAELEIENFKKVSLDIDYKVIINPSDLATQEEIYRKKDEEEKNFFKLPGDLGKYLGNQKRGDVVAYYGPAKVGKSFTLINQYKYGILSKKKTLFWSIEMTDTEVLPRTNKAFFPMIDKEPGTYTFPVFDCEHNQTSNCSDRLSPTVVKEGDNILPDPSHETCTKCMRHFDPKERKRFELDFYQASIYRTKDDIFEIRKQYKKFQALWNKYGRLSVHPKYSLTYEGMMRDLDMLWKRDKWFPDIMILDYIDILGIGSKFDDYREDDEKWKLLAKIAGQCNCLFITATQANKAGHSTDVLSAKHQGGFYGKNRHVNLMVGLNQKPKDKERGVMNFGISEARSIQYITGQMCAVLQDFSTGQAYLDSYCPYIF
jgi:hypothetical protein